jgi:hypothetical protein
MNPLDPGIGLAIRFRAICSYIEETRQRAVATTNDQEKSDLIDELVNALCVRTELLKEMEREMQR